jgi:hypothetical protein
MYNRKNYNLISQNLTKSKTLRDLLKKKRPTQNNEMDAFGD